MRVHPTRGCPWLWLSGTIFPAGDRLPANESLQRGASWARGRLEARKSVLARPVLRCTSVYIAKRDPPHPPSLHASPPRRGGARMIVWFYSDSADASKVRVNANGHMPCHHPPPPLWIKISTRAPRGPDTPPPQLKKNMSWCLAPYSRSLDWLVGRVQDIDTPPPQLKKKHALVSGTLLT